MLARNIIGLIIIFSLFCFQPLIAQTEQDIPLLHQVGSEAMPQLIAPFQNLPFKMPQLTRPIFPDYSLNIKEEGAKESESITQLVNHLITKISQQGGGRLIVPKGKWKSGRIILKSNVNLHLSEGAEIEFSGNAIDYLPSVLTTHEGVGIMGAGAFIYANGEENIAVTGKGLICGPSMDAPVRQNSNSIAGIVDQFPDEVERRIFDGMDGRHFFSPKVFSPINCRNVLCEGITVKRCLFWNINPIYCENVILRGITVESINIPSGDGVDLTSCKNILIEYCTMNCGDDCYALKGGRSEEGFKVGKPTENVVIRYCLAKDGHGGVTVGSETAGGIKNVYAYGCVFDGTQIGIRFKTRRLRAGVSENLLYENFRMVNVRDAFTWDLLGSQRFMGNLANRLPLQPVTELTPDIKNIRIRNFIVESSKCLLVANGIPELPFSNVILENGSIRCNKLIPVMNDFDNVIMRNLSIKSDDNNIKILDGTGLLLDDIVFSLPENKLYIKVKGKRAGDINYRHIGLPVEIIKE